MGNTVPTRDSAVCGAALLGPAPHGAWGTGHGAWGTAGPAPRGQRHPRPGSGALAPPHGALLHSGTPPLGPPGVHLEAGSDSASLAGAAAAEPVERQDAALARGREAVRL